MHRLILISANTHKKPYAVYPLALSYLQSYVQDKIDAIEIQLVDMNWTNEQQLVSMIETWKPNFVGVSLRNIDDVDITSQNYFVSQYQRLLGLIRKNFSGSLIIGGAGFSIYPEILIKELQPDFAVTGEGEAALVNLLDALINNKPTNNLDGILYPGSQLDSIQKKQYIKKPLLNFDAGLAIQYWKESGMLNIQTKRGCPYSCVYCSYPIIDGRSVRTLDPQQIVDSIRQLKNKHEINYVFFTDSVFNIKNQFNRSLARKIISDRLDIQWGAYFSPYQLKYDDLALYQESGLTHVEFGTESLSDVTLQAYKKPFSVAEVFDAANACDKLGLYQAHFLILGGPKETSATITETINNADNLPRCVLFPYLGMRIYPQTGLHQLALQEGLINQDDNLLKPTYYQSSCLETIDLSTQLKNRKNNWVLPNEDFSVVADKLRKKGNRNGPLWEYLL